MNKMNKREIKFIKDFIDQFEYCKKFTLENICKHFNFGKSFFYNLIKKLNLNTYKDFLLYINDLAKKENIGENNIVSQCTCFYWKEPSENIVELIRKIKNKKLFLVGKGYSHISATELLYFINKFKKDTEIMDINKEWSWKDMELKTSNSVYLIYSFKGINKDILDFLKYINKQKGVYIFVVTSNKENIYKRFVNQFIYVDDEPINYRQINLSPIIPFIKINYFIKYEFYKINNISDIDIFNIIN